MCVYWRSQHSVCGEHVGKSYTNMKFGQTFFGRHSDIVENARGLNGDTTCNMTLYTSEVEFLAFEILATKTCGM